jgi:HEAT repeat protein
MDVPVRRESFIRLPALVYAFGLPVGLKRFHRFSLALAVLGATASGPYVYSQPARELDPARIVSGQVAALARQLVDPAIDQEIRDGAARRLISIGSAEARSAISFALKDPGNVGGRLAAARAVAEDLPPDPQFIDALFVLLDPGQRREILDAAVVALGNYKSSADVNARLIILTGAGSPDVVRIAAIRALSHHFEKNGAKRLVELTEDANPQVAFTAVEALQTLSSIQFNSAGDWSNWWRTHADQPADQFRSEMSAARVSALEQSMRQRDDAILELRRSIEAAIAGAGNGELSDVLNRYLTSPRESVRIVAVGQAYQLATTGDLPANSRAVVRTMLSDPNREIRLQSARIISRVNDVAAFDPIVQQIAIESDPAIRAELAGALGVIGNVDAVPLLKAQLEDNSASTVQAAANALAKLGPVLVEKDPRSARELSERLRALLDELPNMPVNSRQREALIAALVPLKQKSMTSMFAQMLTADPREPERIRRLAAAGLGAIGDPNSTEFLVDVMNDTIASTPAVRLEALNAVGRVADSFSLYAPALYTRMDPKFESDADIRTAAWDVITRLFSTASRDQLAGWPDKALIKGDARKELQIFQSLAAKAEAAKDQDEFIQRLEQIGDSYMALGEASVQPERDENFTQATANFQKALDLTRASSGPSGQTERLIESTLKSMLRGRRYNQAAGFASGILSEPTNQQYQVVVGPAFRLEAERLFRQGGQGDDALALIREALQISPSLASTYVEQLRQLQQDIETGRQQKNQLAVPDVIHALARG